MAVCFGDGRGCVSDAVSDGVTDSVGWRVGRVVSRLSLRNTADSSHIWCDLGGIIGPPDSAIVSVSTVGELEGVGNHEKRK